MEEAEQVEEAGETEERDEGDEGEDEAEDHESDLARSKSGRQVKKSRIILEEEEYQQDFAHANNLIHARSGLMHSWKIFEANHPPS